MLDCILWREFEAGFWLTIGVLVACIALGAVVYAIYDASFWNLDFRTY